MAYFQHKEESLKGYKDDKTYLATFTRSLTLRIILKREKVQDKILINVHRAGQHGYICRIGREVTEAERKEILQAYRLLGRKVLESFVFP